MERLAPCTTHRSIQPFVIYGSSSQRDHVFQNRIFSFVIHFQIMYGLGHIMSRVAHEKSTFWSIEPNDDGWRYVAVFEIDNLKNIINIR